MDQQIPFDDFGGLGNTLHFAHANAYPPGSYRRLFRPLADSFHILAIRHRPLWVDAELEMITSWQVFVDDLIQFLDERGLSKVIGAGHSLGAVITAMAARRRPELFRALILIEPVFFTPATLAQIELALKQGTADQMPLVKTARRRRNHWLSKEEAFDHFRAKSVFRRLSDEVLGHYVSEGLIAGDNGGFQLAYSPEMEARVYALCDNDVWPDIARLTLPTLAVKGSESDTLSSEAWHLWQQKQPSAEFFEIEGSGHLLPLEKPDLVADLVIRFADIF